ncbi:MAG: hypothetical protein KDK89_04890 [Alphaproteobacteria bacterium]|nr:hypothetical protein [Alphaproteobacteria bacterium]
MLKIVLSAAVLALVSAAPSWAGGQSDTLGLNWSNEREVYVVPHVDQTIIVQIGDGNDARVIRTEQPRRPQATRLGINTGEVLICNGSVCFYR